jgi:ubiquinone/menaquinone biosynthesis C-methylase UbiE
MSFSGNFTANAGVMSMDVFRVTEQLLTTHDAIVGKEVLEVGCGDGRMTALFQKILVLEQGGCCRRKKGYQPRAKYSFNTHPLSN